ncbi:helicase-related protein [Asticcacaulis sp. EMRT-3]|uniref:helicase-related protein n=1 Tax=Asticcacaulis sp. EMRT-3 TaxID=3040349 RepID=UPI0024AEAEE5|nr:helicase-related protein [Asticcacaulis sp. EMRT-3]MDI7773909.1 helicase-related protein [Asticcacaulis sp. EMRT-3]
MTDLAPTEPSAALPLIHAVSDARLMAVLGPTNTGKTHYAIERMCGYASGMIGLPLRLLAREIYERVVAIKGVNAVALITGEEKIIPRLPSYFVCTVEAMPLERSVDFLCVDEIQLCGDAERGHVFTDRLLHARGRFETLFLGAATFRPLFHRLFPGAAIMMRDRLSHLSYAGQKKLTRLPKRTAIVAFSTEKVYAIAELIRRQRGGAAVVMGGLSPKTRNAQVDLFQRGEVDFLVATDAIGMGLNMDIQHVAFSGLNKFDGKSSRHLTAQEIGQIAGRAGRHMQDGTFGVTGECHELDEDLVHAIENHQFTPLDAAQWRNHKLDFSTLDALLKSLTLPSHTPGLHLAKEALDEKALRALAQDEEIAAKIRNPVSLRALWEACQLPDFRKVGLDEYLKLVSFLFWSRLSPDGLIPEEWFEAQLDDLDKMANSDNSTSDIDTLSSRLSGVRTLSYIAHRGAWLKRIEHWRERTRDLEDRLSDKLHEALMQRFIDARTSALLKALDSDEAPRPEVTPEGQVIIEGHSVGELKGLSFRLSTSQSLIEDKALRQAAFRAVRPVLIDRLRALGQSASKAFRIRSQQVLWNHEPVAEIEPGDYFTPRLRLIDGPDHPALTEHAIKRIGDYVRQTAQHQFKSLWKVKQAADAEGTAANVRAIAFRLYENGGVLHRDETLKLSPEDKAALKALGVAGHRYAWFLPDMLSPKLRPLLQAFGKLEGGPAEGQRQASQKGQLLLDNYGPVSMKTLSQLDRIMNGGRFQKGAIYVKPSDFAALGLSETQRDKLLQALGLVKVEPITVGEPVPVVAPAEDAPEAMAGKRRRRRGRKAAAVAEASPVTEAASETAGDVSEAVVEPTIGEAAPDVPEAPQAGVETVEAVAAAEPPAPLAEAPEITAPVTETREVELIGWRQKSLEPRPARPARHRRSAEDKPRQERKAEAGRGPRTGGKGGKPEGKASAKPGEPKRSNEPYINPFSPFADLRARLDSKVGQD